MTTLPDFLLSVTTQALKGLLVCPDKKLLHFILNVCANATRNPNISYSAKQRTKLKRFEQDIIKIGDPKFPLKKKKSLIRKRGHLFLKFLIKPHLNAFRELV